jgi:hypothetical protein
MSYEAEAWYLVVSLVEAMQALHCGPEEDTCHMA